MSDTYVDDRTPEEREAGIARMTAWLQTLPPDLAKMWNDLRRMDPKGFPRHKTAAADRHERNEVDWLQPETPRDLITPGDA